jgi:hypothetical protein
MRVYIYESILFDTIIDDDDITADSTRPAVNFNITQKKESNISYENRELS